MTAAASSAPTLRVALARRRYVAVLLLLATVVIVNALHFTAHGSWLPTGATEDLSGAIDQPDCVKIDEFHRDPLFRLNASNCTTQDQVVSTLRELVPTAARLFQSHGLRYFLDSGTLLGAFRNQSIIAHDTDADMAIDEKSFDFIRNNKVVVPDPFFLAVYASGDLYPGSQRDKGIPIRLTHKPTALYLDVFVFSKREEEVPASGRNKSNKLGKKMEMIGPHPSWAFQRCVHCTDYYNEGRQLLVPNDWIYPTVDCAFEGATLQCPRETEKYLRYMFGDDFRTPIQY